MNTTGISFRTVLLGLLGLQVITLAGCRNKTPSAGSTLLNVSYDPTRELYADVNQAFIEYWKSKTGQTLAIKQSHGGSGGQARAVIDGLEADVVTLALAHDIDQIATRSQLIDAGWQKRFPHNSCPYTSIIVFLVRKGNPKAIKGWDDLARDDVKVITPDPKSSGGARWNYLAAYGYSLRKTGGDEAQARAFVGKIIANVPVWDSGARGATNTFLQHEQGDVLLTWENEALLALNELGKEKVDLVVPPVSILAEPPVAVVDKMAARHGTQEIARAYLDFLYTDEGQQLAAKHYYRPRVESASEKAGRSFAKVELFTIDDVFGGWAKAQQTHFADGAIFDQLLKATRR